MGHATEREWSYAQKAIIIARYILEHGSITISQARRITGGSKWQVHRLLYEIDAALPVYREGKSVVLLV